MIKFFKTFFLIISLFIIVFSSLGIINTEVSYAETNITKKFKEKDYVDKYCTGLKEYVLPDRTRVDCLTDEYVIEFDYAKKWAESIGQSLYYAKVTGKKPAVAIITSGKKDVKYINRIKQIDKDITIFEIPVIKSTD